MDRRAHSGLRLRRGKLQCSCGLHSTECVACHERGRARSRAAESNGGCSSGVERLTVAQEVAGSKPVTRPKYIRKFRLVSAFGPWPKVQGHTRVTQRAVVVLVHLLGLSNV